MTNLSSTNAIALAVVAFLISVPTKADVLNIGLDLSGSVPLVVNPAFANRVADYLRSSILKLRTDDRVKLQTFGVYGMVHNSRRLDITISRRDRAPQVAETVYAIVRSVPQLVRNSKIEVQGETNILGYLESEAHLLNCASEPTEIVLVSDGVENSALVRDQDLISGKKKLPNLPENLLTGCSMTILGIGQVAQGASAPFAQKLIAAWTEWARSAGISNFRVRPSF
jgi:hypothetical protein